MDDIESRIRTALSMFNFDLSKLELVITARAAAGLSMQIDDMAKKLCEVASKMPVGKAVICSTAEDCGYTPSIERVDYEYHTNYFYFWAFETPWVIQVWLKTLTGYLLVSMEVLLRVVISKGPAPRHPKHAGFLSFEDGTLNILIEV